MTAKVSDFVSLLLMKQHTTYLNSSYPKSDEITHLNGKGDSTKYRNIAKRKNPLQTGIAKINSEGG